jgi:hypothetical protein
MRFTYEVVNRQFLKAIRNRTIKEDEARALLRQMSAKHKGAIQLLAVFSGVIALSFILLGLTLWLTENQAPSHVMVGGLIAFFTGFFGLIFAVNSFQLAWRYLQALKKSYPQIW